MNKITTIRLEGVLDQRLENLATSTARTKTFYIKKAIEEFLDKQEDYLLGLAVLESNEEEYSLAEVEDILNKER